MRSLYFFMLFVGLNSTSFSKIPTVNTQKVTFTSSPTGADLYVNGELIGSTPIAIELEIERTNFIKVKYGDASKTIELKGQQSGAWVFVTGATPTTKKGLHYPDSFHIEISSAKPAVANISPATPSTLEKPGAEVEKPGVSLQALPVNLQPKAVVPATTTNADDPFGLNLKKLILRQLFDELPKRGMPSVANPADSSNVYVFLLGKKNVSTYMTDVLTVPMYSDTTWLSAKDTKRRFSKQIGLSYAKVALVGFFVDSVAAYKAWHSFKDTTIAHGINYIPVAFDVFPDYSADVQTDFSLPVGKTTPQTNGRETKVINLPDVQISGKYRPTIGIMPIIDTETMLNQQFLIYQYLIDNPIIINQKDTLIPSLADYRAYTQFTVGGSMDGNEYIFKLWQKEKPLAEISISINEKTSLDERMTLIARQLGRILSGNTENYTIRTKVRARNLIDNEETIKREVGKGTAITTLFPSATRHYLPAFELPAKLSHLATRITDKPYTEKPVPNLMAQTVRAIYKESDEKQFFFTNGDIPDEMKAAVRKITQPTSRRIGSALSYLAVGDAFLSIEKNLDAAACSYYSALLLSHNLAASPLEKCTVKQLVYTRMKQVAEARNQPYLADLFSLAADLNSSFSESYLATQSHREYYETLEKTALICQDAERQARDIRAQKRLNAVMAITAAAGAGAAAAKAGASGLSYATQNQLTNLMAGAQGITKNKQAIFAESFADVHYETFEVPDESGDEIEINKYYLNLEVMWHLSARKDIDVVGKRLLQHAADKPNLRIALEEYLVESDESEQNTAVNEFRNKFEYLETQAISYESWGRRLPKKVSGRF